MPTRLNPYLNFQGSAREAMTFYRDIFGGELTLSTFGEYQATDDPAQIDNIMHAQLITPDGLTLMGADVMEGQDYRQGTNFSVSLSGDDESELRGYWDGLADGATIVEPLVLAPWGDTFGMLNDRYGVSWLVNIAGNGSES
ncbi:VOC family protein [Mycetocola sp. 2940]|uniref:VOC family protein n=1 Tax=Mycetocola sp. 2940 TaxID=3156452 RepID=UPI003396BBD1